MELLAASAPSVAKSIGSEDSATPDSGETGTGDVPIAVGAHTAPSVAAEGSDPKAMRADAALTPVPAAPTAAVDAQAEAPPADTATSAGTTAAAEEGEGSPEPNDGDVGGGAETETAAEAEVQAEKGAANGNATKRTTARKTGAEAATSFDNTSAVMNT